MCLLSEDFESDYGHVFFWLAENDDLSWHEGNALLCFDNLFLLVMNFTVGIEIYFTPSFSTIVLL